MSASPLMALAVLLFPAVFCGIASSCGDGRRAVAFLFIMGCASVCGFCALAMAFAGPGALVCAIAALVLSGAQLLVGIGLLRRQAPGEENPWIS